MVIFFLRRLFASIFVIIGVVTLVFFILRAVPGDPVESILGEQALEVDKQSLRDCLNLDAPLHVQYGLFWKDVANGSLGHLCDDRGVTVRERVADNIPATFQLALASMLIAIMLSMPLGVAASLRPYSWV